GFSAPFAGDLPYWMISAIIVLGWVWSLSLNDSRSHRVLGLGPTEYLRVISASVRFFGLVAIIAFLAKADLARGFLLLSLPIGVLALLVSRLIWRRWLLRRRARGSYAAQVVIVGSVASVTHLVDELNRAPSAGFAVRGACLPAHARTED